MKKTFLLFAVVCLTLHLAAQKEKSAKANEEGNPEEEKTPFKEHLFTGGTLTVSFYNSGTVLGANPYVGYKIANWVDAGIVFNYTYAGSRDNIFSISLSFLFDPFNNSGKIILDNSSHVIYPL